MRTITKCMLTLALIVAGVGGAKAEKLYADLSQYGDKWDGTDVTFSWTATWGNQLGPNLTGSPVGLPTGDLTTWTKLVVVVDELNNCDFFRVLVYSGTDTGHNNTFKANKTGVNEFTLEGGVDFLNQVTRICLSGSNGEDSKSGTWSETPASFKVKEVYLERPDVIFITEEEVYAAPAGTSDLNGMTGADSNPWTIAYPQLVENETLFGGDIDSDNKSVDIDSYDYLHFVVTDASVDAHTGLRVFVWDGSARQCLYPHPIAEYADVTDWTAKSWITAPGIYVVKISDYPLLRGFKALQGWAENAGTITVSMAYLSTGAAPVNYVSTGSFTRAGEAAIDDPTAVCFDVTGLSATGITYTPANPNALFIAKAGTLTNTKNVIVSGVCANLELTDGYPFKAPADFTATAAKYTKTVSDAGHATAVIPFAAALPTGIEAYNVTAASSYATLEAAGAIAANKPVVLKAAAKDYDFTASNVTVAATPEEAVNNGVLYANYCETTPDNAYVLAKKEEIGFYKLAADEVVPAGKAYLKIASSAPEFIGISGEATGINTVNVQKADNAIYNLGGQRVANAQKGIFIVNGKKVIK